MVFNSISFCLFIFVVFVVYYVVFKEKTKLQNWFLLLASYFFYGFADWRMLPLLFTATLIIYFLGIAIHKTSSPKKAYRLTFIGVLTGIGLLLYFKYFNFFIDSFSSLFNAFGIQTNHSTFDIIMPLGISFFTFKLISYTIEIHRKKIDPTSDFIAFSTYISFFPTILSGPIDKPNTFIPQLVTKRSFNYKLVVDGCRQILWGLFQKMVISDNLATVVDAVWLDIPNQTGVVIFITAILYSFQLYTDFSGYSHMAIGVGKLLGFKITKNFNYPYFARNIAEFWRNWHMSLTSWLTDYVFMPLNIKFRDLGKIGMILAIVINMLAVGIWHGANWTFILFGLYNGLLYIPLIISGAFFKKKKLKTNTYRLPTGKDLLKIIGTFMLVTLGFVIFRAQNLAQASEFLIGVFNLSIPTWDVLRGLGFISTLIPALFFMLALLLTEWRFKDSEHPLSVFAINWKWPYRWALYSFMIFAIGMFMRTTETSFIYFQF